MQVVFDAKGKRGVLILKLLGAVGALVIAGLAMNAGGAQEKADKPAATYVGSAACKGCHAKVFETWSESTHGKYMLQDSLPQDHKGCEACHGPASLHVGAPADNKPWIPNTAEPAKTNTVCGKCHNQVKSDKELPKWQNVSQSDYSHNTHSRKKISCVSCHTGHSGETEKSLIKPEKELCLSCHASVLESAPGKKAEYTHSPVAMGNCSSCHDVHGTKDRRMVVNNLAKACETCHKSSDEKLTKAHMGYPVKDANCASCHDAHSHNKGSKLLRVEQHGPFARRNCETCHTKPEAGKPIGLVKPANELCFTCHPKDSVMAGKENAHLPVKQGFCISCHDPHAGDAKASLMKTRPAYACFTCHAKIESDTLKPYRHKILEDKLNCMLCHKPHSSPQVDLLVKNQKDLCGQCHKHQFSHPLDVHKDGTPVVDPTTKKQMTCASCHNNHGSDFEALTILDKKRDLCLKCHDEGH